MNTCLADKRGQRHRGCDYINSSRRRRCQHLLNYMVKGSETGFPATWEKAFGCVTVRFIGDDRLLSHGAETSVKEGRKPSSGSHR